MVGSCAGSRLRGGGALYANKCEQKGKRSNASIKLWEHWGEVFRTGESTVVCSHLRIRRRWRFDMGVMAHISRTVTLLPHEGRCATLVTLGMEGEVSN